MSIERDLFCLMALLAIPEAVELSVWTGVAGCGRLMSLSVCRRIRPSFMLLNNAPSSASDADAATCRRMPVGLRIAPLLISVLSGVLPRR